MAERAVESTQHSATTPEITTREAFCVYRVFFCVGQKLGHHFVEPGVCVYGGVDFVVFFPYAFRVFCGEVLGEDHLGKGAAV